MLALVDEAEEEPSAPPFQEFEVVERLFPISRLGLHLVECRLSSFCLVLLHASLPLTWDFLGILSSSPRNSVFVAVVGWIEFRLFSLLTSP